MNSSSFYPRQVRRSSFYSELAPILVILVLSVVTVTPKLHVRTISMALWAMFFCFEYNKFKGFNGKLKDLFTLGFLFVFICIIYKLIGVSSAKMGYCIASPFLYFAPVLALMIIERCHNEQQIRFLFHFIALAVAVNIADNIWLSYKYGIDNLVFQNLAGAIEEEGVTGLNLGGSLFVNLVVFYACIMFLAFLKSNKKLEKLLLMIYVGISAYFIIMCSLKASAIILVLISFVSMYVSAKSKEHVGTILLLMAVVGALAFLFMDSIINILISVIDSERITSRLIIFTSTGNVSDADSFLARSDLWQVSIKSWLSSVSSFFFGIGDHDWNDFMTTEASGIGAHSDLLDVLARYGIVGALILYSSFKMYYDYLKKRYGTNFKYEIISFFILILLMGLTKRMVNEQPAIMIFILFPLTLRCFTNKESNKYKKILLIQ